MLLTNHDFFYTTDGVLPPMDLVLTRSGYYDDRFDDFLSMDSWSGEAVVQESVDPQLRVRVMVRVQGRRKRRRCYPAAWSAHLKVSDFGSPEPIAKGRCKSLTDVVRQVKALNLTKNIQSFLRAFYGQQNATCVWTERTNTKYRPSRWDVLTTEFVRADADMLPFASMFVAFSRMFSYWGSPVSTCVPDGTYITKDSGFTRLSLVKISSYYSESGIEALDGCIPWV